MSFNNKPRKPLPRYTPLNRGTPQLARTGFKNRGKGLKSKPKRESPERAAYRDANKLCEITYHLPLDHPARLRDFRPDHIHHILWGAADREEDIPTNLIRVTAKVHDWIHANKNDGLALCLWKKWQKCELDWRELERIGKPNKFPGYVETHKPTESWIVPLWAALIGGER